MLIQTLRYDVDILARNLHSLAWEIRQMPPSWDGGEDTLALYTTTGHVLGRCLPGRGIIIDQSLKEFGIRRMIPGVFERDPVARLIDILRDQRGAIASHADVVSAYQSAHQIAYYKKSYSSSSLVWSSCFGSASGFPGNAGTHTAIPGGAVLDRTNAGAWSNQLVNPVSGKKKYIVALGVNHASSVIQAMLVDLLVSAGSIDHTVDTAQTVNTTALTRYTDGVGVMMINEVTTTLGGSAQNVTVNSYTNQSGTGSRTTGAQLVSTNAVAQRLIPVTIGPLYPLESGDYGVKSVEEITFSASNSAGVSAICLYKPLSMLLCTLPSDTHWAERTNPDTLEGAIELATASGVLGCLTVFQKNTGGSTQNVNYGMIAIDG